MLFVILVKTHTKSEIVDLIKSVNIKSQVIRIFCCIVRQKKEQLSIFLFRIYWDLTFHVSLLLKKKHLIYVSVTRFDNYSLFKMRIVKFETIVSIKIQELP